MGKIKGETPSGQMESTSEEKLSAYIEELRTERNRVAEEHAAYLAKHPPVGIGPHGSERVFALSNKILSAVEVGKKLGLVPEDVDPYSFF